MNEYQQIVTLLENEKKESELLKSFVQERLDSCIEELKNIPEQKDKELYLQNEIIERYVYLVGSQSSLLSSMNRSLKEEREIQLRIMQENKLIYKLNRLIKEMK